MHSLTAPSTLASAGPRSPRRSVSAGRPHGSGTGAAMAPDRASMPRPGRRARALCKRQVGRDNLSCQL